MIKIQVLDEVARPTRGHYTDAGIDLKNTKPIKLEPGKSTKVLFGIKTSFPTGYVGLVFPRSGLGSKGLRLKNTVGVIDSDYRGELMGFIENTGDKEIELEAGSRIAQLVVVPCLFGDIQFVNELRSTDRGEKGFGSTGV